MNKFSTWLWRTAFWLRYKVGYGLKVYGRDNFPMEGICGYYLHIIVNFMSIQ